MTSRLRLCLSRSIFVACLLTPTLQAQTPSSRFAASPHGPYRISSSSLLARVLLHKEPEYPAGAQQDHISGVVILNVRVSSEGSVVDIEAVSGPRELRDAAIAAVKQWTFKPLLFNGKAMEVVSTLNVAFHS